MQMLVKRGLFKPLLRSNLHVLIVGRVPIVPRRIIIIPYTQGSMNNSKAFYIE